MALPRPSSPRAFWADLKAFVATRERHQIIFALLAAAMPAIIVIGFITDARTNIMPGRRIIYVESWPADRSDAQIIAQQKIDQKTREALLAERRKSYQRLADQLGIDYSSDQRPAR